MGGGEAPPQSAGAAGELKPNRAGAAGGILSAAIGLGGVAVAIAMAPWFSWTVNALSDLGHPSHESAIAFNVSLVASGLLNLVFIWAVARELPPTRTGKAAPLLLAAGAVSLAGVGAVNESFGVAHLIVSITYFTFVALGIFVAGLAVRPFAPALAMLSMATGAVSGVFGVTVGTALVYGTPFPSQAIPELIASLMFAAWTVWVASFLWKGCFPRESPH